MNKRGILRIAEATIAIILIIGFLIFAQVRANGTNEVDFSGRIYDVLEEIAKSPELRNDVFIEEDFNSEGFAHEDSQIYLFVKERIPESYLTVEIRVCEKIDEICSIGKFIDGEVYVGQRVIVPSVEQQEFKAKKLAIFAYRK